MHALSATVLAATLLANGGQSGQSAPTAGDIYTATYSREQALRASTGTPAPTVREYRFIVGAYDNLVRRFPQSGYADDALWQGGALASDAFERFGEERDRATARRMLQLLVNGYPYSPFTPKAREALKALADRPATPSLAAPVPPGPAVLASPEKVVVLRSVTRTAMPDRVRITLDLDSATTYRSERVEDPPRVLLDIRDTQPGPEALVGTRNYKDSAASYVRVGLQTNHITRVVISLDGVGRYHLSTTDQPYRIVIDCERATPVATLTAKPTVAPTPAAPARIETRPASTPLAARIIRQGLPRPPTVDSIDSALLHPPEPVHGRAKAAPAAALVAVPTPQPSAPKATMTPAAPITGVRGPYSLTRQLGLGVSKIVIDPGHGGHDPGALGAGVTEAEVVLDISLRLEKLLLDAGVDVVLTRRTDEYVPLEERPAIARREQADLFLSVHANASRTRTVRGTETYFLNFSTDPAAEEVAARENAATNRTIGNLPDILKAMTLNNKLDESRTFAGLIQKAMAAQLSGVNSGMRNLGVKQAPFVVLIGAEMPSVLVEIAFITNPQEGKLLKNGAYRQKIAQALFDAVRGYQQSLKSDPVAMR
jgi:N-acetylmuramoyl-L-alanine amidase